MKSQHHIVHHISYREWPKIRSGNPWGAVHD